MFPHPPPTNTHTHTILFETLISNSKCGKTFYVMKDGFKVNLFVINKVFNVSSPLKFNKLKLEARKKKDP
jgi:hypothetical protein